MIMKCSRISVIEVEMGNGAGKGHARGTRGGCERMTDKTQKRNQATSMSEEACTEMHLIERTLGAGACVVLRITPNPGGWDLITLLRSYNTSDMFRK